MEQRNPTLPSNAISCLRARNPILTNKIALTPVTLRYELAGVISSSKCVTGSWSQALMS
jgi:hypothetical protein